MKIEVPSWMFQGAGQPPEQMFSFRAEGEITGFSGMQEAEDLVVTDEIGTLYRLDPLLNVKLLTRLQEPARLLSWADTGQAGVALLGHSTVIRIDEKLKVEWTIDLPFTCTALAIDPYGTFALAAADEGGAVIIDDRGKKAATLKTMRPLAFARFLIDEPAIIAAAEHGLLGAYEVSGKKIWEQALWSNVGDLSVIHKTSRICLASMNQGIQIYDGHGETHASLILEGTVNRVAANYTGKQAFASTVERHLYRLDEDGEMKWAATGEAGVKYLYAHPIERVGVFVFDNGQILRASW